MPFLATDMPPIAIASRSRSAFSPDLPIAMTMRPQLASSPAMAVLTSGELAIGERNPARRPVVLGAGHRDLDQLLGAFAVLHHLERQIEA